VSAAVDVLLVEDHAGDVILVQEALAPFGNQLRLHVAGDGVQALQLLTDPAFPCPRFVLMDLHTPRMGALEVLAELRQPGPWAALPVVVYSSSAHAADARRAYEVGANAYLIKPDGLDRFVDMLQTTVRFWLMTFPGDGLSPRPE